jgi:hypothetical protein
MNTHIEKAVNGAALRPLAREQKTALVLMARDAFRRRPDPDRCLDFEEWRHRECMMAVERHGLTECRNEDFLPLKAHFIGLLGRTQAAEQIRVRAACEPRQWAMHTFERECAKAADVLPHAREYAAGFLRRARKVTLDDATEKQIWQAIFLVRRRAAQLRRKELPANGANGRESNPVTLKPCNSVTHHQGELL